jgi:hypothetical protein
VLGADVSTSSNGTRLLTVCGSLQGRSHRAASMSQPPWPLRRRHGRRLRPAARHPPFDPDREDAPSEVLDDWRSASPQPQRCSSPRPSTRGGVAAS